MTFVGNFRNTNKNYSGNTSINLCNFNFNIWSHWVLNVKIHLIFADTVMWLKYWYTYRLHNFNFVNSCLPMYLLSSVTSCKNTKYSIFFQKVTTVVWLKSDVFENSSKIIRLFLLENFLPKAFINCQSVHTAIEWQNKMFMQLTSQQYLYKVGY